jgi:hypothetical protein
MVLEQAMALAMELVQVLVSKIRVSSIYRRLISLVYCGGVLKADYCVQYASSGLKIDSIMSILPTISFTMSDKGTVIRQTPQDYLIQKDGVFCIPFRKAS